MNPTILAEINLSATIARLNDCERIVWLTALLETVSEEGTIGEMRDLLAQARWNDQPPREK